jgi:3-hydroxymyristoyl/3-hydroxydecanoyl-(acyl carrier protein) dehydratase
MSAAAGETFRLLDGEPAERGRRFRVEIPAASPLFAGHFPGHPILPGMAHLAVVERAVGPLAAVRSLKLRRPVLPGSVLDLAVRETEEAGWTRFDLRAGEEAVSGGTVRTGPFEKPAREPDEVASPSTTDFPPVQTLLPHAPPARFIRSIIAASAGEVLCAAEIPSLHPLVEGGRIPAFAGIEAGAQAAAVLEALNRRGPRGPRIGYLVGVREARFGAPVLTAGRILRVTARLQGGAFPLSLYEIAVGDQGREYVTGSISTFITGP